MTRLSLRSNALTRLPDGITQLGKLSMLDLGQNALRELPAHFGRLSSLKHLYLSANKLIALPLDMGTRRWLDSTSAYFWQVISANWRLWTVR